MRSSCLNSLLLLLTLVSVGNATSYATRYDKFLFCISLEDGKLVWRSQEDRYGLAEFEVYPQGVTVHVRCFKCDPVEFRDPDTGTRIKPFKRDTRGYRWTSGLLAESPLRSHNFEARKQIRLANGWISHGNYSRSWNEAGDYQIHFVTPGRRHWTLNLPKGTAREIQHIKNTVFLHQGSRLLAHDAGQDQPRWTIDLSQTRKPLELTDDLGMKRKSSAFSYGIINDRLFVEYGGELIQFDPQTGQSIKSFRYSQQLSDHTAEGLRINRGCLITGEGDYAILDKKTHLICLDVARQKLLWTAYIGPYYTFSKPMVYKGRVYGFASKDSKIYRTP